MKTYFTTGLAILLPVVLTVVILGFLINFITAPFLTPMQALLTNTKVFHWFSFEALLVTAISKILILILLVACIILIGFLGKLYFIEMLFTFGDRVLHHVPFFNRVYKICQDVIHSLFSSTSQTFSRTVFIPFPFNNTTVMGLVSSESVPLVMPSMESKELVSITVFGGINPTFGIIVLMEKDKILNSNLKINETMKFLVSCGAASHSQPPSAQNENE